ncbi:MAG TPA: 7-cyano-7-deazaguanine synthase QueC [Rhodospirillaceae bacterium]|nr:7-cyano-7-deazaguanine synthase QueC [Rhodospirillaceae bacterium]HAT35681.1 7-cyano-7-deazaguanine synthase QueC [Rhodospirillaceae bacterium]|tara:strand:+ start:43 stop:780 length:738 start_codon:yes stop_codon:yes gene_type:complete
MTIHLGVILLSGGLDSTTLAALILTRDIRLSALTFDYGQTHRRELEAASAIANRLGIDQSVVDVSFYRNLANHSALTNSDTHFLPTGRSESEMATDIPITYVPLRNTFFLTLAAARLESLALAEIEDNGTAPDQVKATLFIAANAIDYSGYPDCRPEYYQAAKDALNRGSKLWTQYGVGFRIETPLIEMSKAEIVQSAIDVGAPIDLSWSCYRDGETPCGACDSCLLRAKGFSEASATDPALPSS